MFDVSANRNTLSRALAFAGFVAIAMPAAAADLVWTTKASMPTARQYLAAASAGGTIYVLGGSNFNVLDTLEAYDPATNTWTTKASMPTGRLGLTSAVVGGIVY